MTYNLATKLRPQKIADIYGQKHITDILTANVQKRSLPKAYFFTGERGTGKTTSARLLAKAYNCENTSKGDACGSCGNCKQMKTNFPSYLDELDCASHSTKESIPYIAQTISPAPNGTKFVILDEAHMFSTKTWKEISRIIENIENGKVCCVFCTTEHLKIPNEIKAIGNVLHFNLLTETEIADFLSHISKKYNLKLSSSHIEAASSMAGGSLRDSLSAMDIILSGGEPEIPKWEELLEALAEKNAAKAMAFFNHQITRKGTPPDIIAKQATEILRGVFQAQIDIETNHPSATSLSKKYAPKISLKTSVAAIEHLGWAIADIKAGTYHDDTLGLELPIAKIFQTEPENKKEPELRKPQQEKVDVKTLPKPEAVQEQTLMEQMFSDHIPLSEEEKAEKNVMQKTSTDNVMAEIFG